MGPQPEAAPSALSDLVVLDLADGKGLYCTRLLAGLGAEIIKLEPPGGDVTRSVGPFYHDTPDPEKSLYFWQYNVNKKGITLSLEQPEGVQLFRRLAAGADIVVETFQPGYLAGLGLSFPELHALNPRLILTSITGFGQTGPYSQYKATDLIGLAMGTQLNLCGFQDRAPVRTGASQGHHQASLHAAAATMVALFWRDLSGEGQHVDVSMQEAVAADLQWTMALYDLTGVIRNREGSRLSPCLDGYVRHNLGAGWDDLVEWMAGEGMAEDLAEPGYQEVTVRRAQQAHINEVLNSFLATHTKAEIYREAVARRLPICPSSTAAELAEDPHLNARSFFMPVEHPELGESFLYPGPPVRMTETPWVMERRPPHIGEHNQEVYCGRLGLAAEELRELQRRGVI
ncbi:MAG: CoA transferase [Chloroflexi bacterium]|nr:CoA transferase [Chloroflexota bacterium]